MTTEKQIHANKKNAQKSTGSKGIDKTKFNTVKHGILSQKFFRVATNEEKEAIESLRESLVEEIKKQHDPTISDWLSIEITLSSWWRLRTITDQEVAYFRNCFNIGLTNAIHDFMSNKGRVIAILSIVLVLLNAIHDFMSNKGRYPRTNQKATDLIYCPINEQLELLRRYRVSAENSFYRALNELKDKNLASFRKKDSYGEYSD